MLCPDCEVTMEYLDPETDWLTDAPQFECPKCGKVIYLDELPEDHPERKGR